MSTTYAALSAEMARVTQSPYPAALSSLRQRVRQCSLADVSQWAAAQPCHVDALAARVVDGLQQQSCGGDVAVDVVAALAHNGACRDAFLRHEPTLLHSVVARAVQSGDVRGRYARASVALLARPLPPAIALPADAQALFVQLVEHAARSPSPASIAPVYLLLTGTGTLLLPVLAAHVRARLEQQLLDILRGVNGTSALSLYCLSIMHTVCRSADPDVRLTTSSYSTQDFLASTSASPAGQSEAMQQFFTGSKAQRSTQLVVLLVLWATKTDAGDSLDEKTTALVLANQVIAAVPVDLRKIWCAANPMLCRKLHERLCSEDLAGPPKTLALRFAGLLCELHSLPHPVAQSLEMTFVEVGSVHAVRTLCPHLDYRDLLASVLARAPINRLLEKAVDCAGRAGSAELAAGLDAVTDAIAAAHVIVGNQTTTMHQTRELLADEAFVDRLQKLQALLVQPKPCSTSSPSAGWCERALSRARCKLAHQLSNLLLRASQSAAVGSQAMTVLLDLHASSARGDGPCSHDRPSWREVLTFSPDDDGSREEHNDVDWREALHTHFTARARVEHDAVTRLFTKACANLEARCEGVEKPLRDEQRRRAMAEEQIAQLTRAFAELESRCMDLTVQNGSLERDRNQYSRHLDDCRESLGDAEKRNDEAFQRVTRLEEQLRNVQEAGQRQLTELKEAKQTAELHGQARLAQKQEQLEDVQEELTRLKSQLDAEVERASDAEHTLEDLRTELHGTKEQLTTSDSALKQIQLEMGALEQKAEQQRSHTSSLEEQLRAASSSGAAKTQHMSELRAELEMCQRDRDRLESELVRRTEEMQHESEHQRQELERLVKENSESSESLRQQIYDVKRDLSQTRDALSSDIATRDAKIADLKKRVARYHHQCEQKDQQIAQAESMRASLMAAMGIGKPPHRARGSHRSRESMPPVTETPAEPSPPTPTSASNMDFDASSFDPSFASRASSSQGTPSARTPQRPRPPKSLSFAAPLTATAQPRASTGPRTRRSSNATRPSMGRQALQGVSANRASPKPPQTPTQEAQKQQPRGEDDGCAFDGSELFGGTQDQKALLHLHAAF